MTTFNNFLAESKNDFATEFRKSLKKDMRAIETAMSKIDDAITRFNGKNEFPKLKFDQW